MKFLIFRQSSLGDVILISPVIHFLRQSYPDSAIDILTKKQYMPLYTADSRVNAIHSFSGDADYLSAVISLRANKYDYLIDLQGNIRSHILSLLLSPIIVSRYDKRRLARNAVVSNPEKKLRVNHSIEAYLGALRPLGIRAALIPPEIQVNGQNRESVEMELGKIKGKSPLIAICPGARHFEKRWPDFADVARELLSDTKLSLVVISSKGEDIEANLGIENPRLISARNWELPKLAALLSLCDLALTNDTGLMHLSESVGTPVLAIFGPTNPRLGFAPSLPDSRAICDDVSCSPCSVHGQKPCFQPVKYCFKNITPERVIIEIKSMLNSNLAS